MFDTIEKEFYEVPELFVEPWSTHAFPSLKDLVVYYDARSAVRREKLAEIDTLKKGTEVIFKNFYRAEGNGSAQIEYTVNGENKSGWLNQDDVGPLTFYGMVAAD